VTLTANAQELFVVRTAPESDALPDPAVAVIVPPPQLPVSPFGVASTRFAGSVSVNATPVSDTVLAPGLVIVKLSEVAPLGGMLAAPNALLIDGGATTARLADAVPPVPPFVEVTAPVVLFCAPAAVPVTFTEKLHEELAAKVEPDKLTLPNPATAVIVPPPQVPVSPFGVATTSPAGNVSLKAIPDKLCVVLLF